MFGMGWMELLIIGGVISLIFGPAALGKIFRTFQQVEKTKSELTGASGLAKLGKLDEALMSLDPGDDDDEE